MQDIPPPVEDRLNLHPVFWECGACQHLILIGPDDSIADLMHTLVGGRPCHPEGKLQGGVAISTGQVSEGDHKLESWTWSLSSRSSPSGAQELISAPALETARVACG